MEYMVGKDDSINNVNSKYIKLLDKYSLKNILLFYKMHALITLCVNAFHTILLIILQKCFYLFYNFAL